MGFMLLNLYFLCIVCIFVVLLLSNALSVILRFTDSDFQKQ